MIKRLLLSAACAAAMMTHAHAAQALARAASICA